MSALPFASDVAACVLAPAVSFYIRSQRERLGRTSSVLSEYFQKQFRSYFNSIDLERVRIVECNSLPVPDPPLASQLRRLGLDFPSPSTAAAITFDYVIAARVALNPSLLFHELVHVVQFRLLGVMKFSRFYVRGFLSGGSYYGIPLEQCAFELERRFEAERSDFDVEREVADWITRKIF